MRVIVDIMGGDKAPEEILRGVAAASEQKICDLILVGRKDAILQTAERIGADVSGFEIVDAPSVVTMEDDPISSMRTKKDASMFVGLHLLANGKGDAFVSAGNTGALFVGATCIVNKIPGIQRAAIATVLPAKIPCLMLDSGANITVSEAHLEQFAVMGSAYVQKVYGVLEPSVGLLNNGTEAGKGTPLQIAANRRLAECSFIRYAGNVEGNAALMDACNVLVTDGFTGNVYLKAIEGAGKRLMSGLKGAFQTNLFTKLAALAVKKPLSTMKRSFDPSEHGGAPILGLAKPVIKAHGSSDARAIHNAIRQAVRYAGSNVICDLTKTAESYAAYQRAQTQR